MREDFSAAIRMSPSYRLGDPVVLWFELTNTSDVDYSLLVWDTPLEGRAGDYVEVRQGERALRYDGRFVKRGDPGPDSYRTVAAGETVTEQIDLTDGFAFDEPGTYDVTVRVEFTDSIPATGVVLTTRVRAVHRGFALEPLHTRCEVLAGEAARPTLGAQARSGQLPRSARQLTISAPRAQAFEGAAGDLFPDPGPAPGEDPLAPDVFSIERSTIAWLDAAIAELGSWSTRQENVIYTEWFGADDAARYATVRDHFARIRNRLNSPHTYDLTPDDCKPGDYAYTHAGDDTVSLCSAYFTAPDTGVDSKFGTFVHEWSHAVAGTADVVYGQTKARNLARTDPANAIRNADSHEYFVETLADRMITAPVVWNNGKAYIFAAGKYYRYDIAGDRVDAGYPKPIAGNWPGLFVDRVDAGIVWNNGKAYFFRDYLYVRYDLATDRVDPGYPLGIASHWPGLWGDRIDAAVMWNNGKAYFFRDSQYMRYDLAADRVDPGYPLPIAGNWPGLWGDMLNGAVMWPNGKAYFFRGWQYEGYDVAADRVGAGYPLAIADNWPVLWQSGLDASVLWNNGKAYFFRGNQYMRYDLAADTVDAGYPLPIAGNWPGLWEDHIDAAVVWNNGKAYFFRGNQYMQYDLASDKVDAGFPRPIAGDWPGLWTDRIDAVVLWNNGKAYFFRDSQYMRYDLATRRVDPGYPLPIAGNWPRLFTDRIDTAVVWNNGKAYFFRGTQYSRYDLAADGVDPTFPYPIGANWYGLPGRVR
jgi:Lysine-specific metallo-endopeptidase/Hemopexin